MGNDIQGKQTGFAQIRDTKKGGFWGMKMPLLRIKHFSPSLPLFLRRVRDWENQSNENENEIVLSERVIQRPAPETLFRLAKA